SDCSGAFAGCERMPAALRAHGLVDSLGVIDGGNLQVVVADPVRDPETGVIGLMDLLGLSEVVRDAVSMPFRTSGSSCWARSTRTTPRDSERRPPASSRRVCRSWCLTSCSRNRLVIR